MTVCVAALADNGKKIVIATDNMATIAIGQTIQYQREDKDSKKLFQLNENVYALTAGALHVINPVIKKAKEEIKTHTTPTKCATIIRESLEKFYLQKTEEELLKRYNIDWDFYRNKQALLGEEVRKDLFNKINNWNLDINIIVVGYDSSNKECYLGVVLANGYLMDKSLENFVTNGSGGELAKFSLILSDYNKSMTVEQVEELVRKAIKDAKKSPGVGDLSELKVIPEENGERNQ
ncbi:MAG: hypothetical protein ACM3KM_01930 [Acidobacteriaceae bacterium]